MTATASPPRRDVPHLADGIQLIGEMEGSGYKDPPSLVRRADGQVIQVTPLLYAVASKADGESDFETIAEQVSSEIGRGVSEDNVRFLVEEKLRPLGILAEADGSSPQAKRLDPLLALKFRTAVIPAGVSRTLATLFKPLFFGPIVLAVLVGFVAFDVWFFGTHGVAQPMREGMYNPGLFLAVFAGVVLSAAFHEIGHAAACRYGGGEPGKMGCGLYLAWPAFYTDVTDAYRLGRVARLRTDLGGVYFNVIVILLTGGLYFATGNEAVLLLVLVQHFEIVHQLLPVVRLDGYYIVADLTGVPDLFTRIKPILVSVLPGRTGDERVTALKPWVRVAVTAWVFVVVPLLLFQLLMVLLHLPRILGTAFDSGQKLVAGIQGDFGSGNALAGVGGIIQLLALSLPVLGILLMVWRLGQRTMTWTWQRTDGRPVLRLLAVTVLAGVAGLLLLTWLPRTNYEPIRRGERGVIGDGIAAVRRLPRNDAPLTTYRRAAAVTTADDPDTPVSEEPVSSTTTSTTLVEEDEVVDEATTTTTTYRSTSTTAARSVATSTPTSTSTSSTSTSTTSTTEQTTTTTEAP